MRKALLVFGGLLFWAVAVIAQDRAALVASVLAAPVGHVRSVTAPGIRIELRGIYVGDGLLWFSVVVRNMSALDVHAVPVRFYIADRRTWRRRARQEIGLGVVVRRETLLVRSDSAVGLCFGVMPRLPGKGQVLTLEYGERMGPRLLRLRVSQKQLLRARKLEMDSHAGVYRGAEQEAGSFAGE